MEHNLELKNDPKGRTNYMSIIIKQCPNLMNLSHVLNPQKPVLIERRLKSWKISYKFIWNQPYLSGGLNLNSGLNSLNSASDNINKIQIYRRSLSMHLDVFQILVRKQWILNR